MDGTMGASSAHFQKLANEGWLLYNRRRQISPDLLRSHVYRAWERSHLLGASHLQPKAERLSIADTHRLLIQKADLLEAARPYMRALSTAARQERHAAMLSDESAVILDVVGDDATVLDPTFPGAGSILTEELSGANGIGTPLTEGRYVELVGVEHFIQGFHAFTCQGLPIRRLDGQVVGSLSTSVRKQEASQRLREIFTVAAQGIEAELALRQLERHMSEMLTAGPGSALPLEKLRQDVIQAYAIGKTSLELASLYWTDEHGVDGRRLLSAAGRAMETFKDQSSLCIDLASSEQGTPEPLAILGVLDRIELLLATEARVHQVELLRGERVDAIVVADRRSLERQVLRMLLAGLAAAAGGCLRIDVLEHEGPGGSVRILPSPIGTPHASASTSQLSLFVPRSTQRGLADAH
jgi:transcriptional regulator of acetoin/glycerol metabolism